MKMIEVFDLMAKGEIKAQTELFVYDNIECIDIYKFDGKAFYNEHGNEIGSDFIISSMFLNYTVELIEPIPKEYYLRLDEDDDLSYVIRSSYNSDFNYDLGSKIELCESITKFTQEEINNDKLLKFIEQHGIKEEVEDNAID